MTSDSGWGAPAFDDGWGASYGSGAGDSGEWGATDSAAPAVPAPTPMVALYAAAAAAGVGLLVGLALFFVARPPTAVSAVVSLVAWLLSGIVSVLLIASYQRADLGKSASAYYSPNPSAALIRVIALGLGVAGVIATSLHFAEWLARR